MPHIDTKSQPQYLELANYPGTSFDVPLGQYSTMKCGGHAFCVYSPKNVDDLAAFRRINTLPETLLGGLSNVIIRSGGISGVVIRLKNVAQCNVSERSVFWAGLRNVDACKMAASQGYSGMEFLIGIPGTIGGAVAMNAGTCGQEVADVLDWVEIMDDCGVVTRVDRRNLNMTYRSGGLPADAMVIRACFRLMPSTQSEVSIKHTQLLLERAKGVRLPPNVGTAGSTFKNPDPGVSDGRKAWQLIDAAGCRGLCHGGAMVSNEHANFLINKGHATPEDLILLGENVRRRVFDFCGVLLEWEVKIIGDEPSGANAVLLRKKN
ncbi:MAG: UDP-N-acetylmuramate dehydrogenase [Holosporales bacterium]|jgi:UDP-N-acetylmuramate dehydrogenase|nr:UDP-N-acetylmuramate dehydrogenase [Holosporales bacterium]